MFTYLHSYQICFDGYTPGPIWVPFVVCSKVKCIIILVAWPWVMGRCYVHIGRCSLLVKLEIIKNLQVFIPDSPSTLFGSLGYFVTGAERGDHRIKHCPRVRQCNYVACCLGDDMLRLCSWLPYELIRMASNLARHHYLRVE